MFALSTGEVDATPDAVGILVCAAVEEAIGDAVRSAKSLGGYVSYQEHLELISSKGGSSS